MHDEKSEVVTYKTWEETLYTIKDLIVNSSLPKLLSDPSTQLLLQIFVPPKEHPFYQEILKAQIPKSPKTESPDLLLHGLPLKISEKELRQAEEGKIDVENDNEIPLREPTKQVLHLGHRMTQLTCKSNCMVLLGVSGCSKTRTIYEVLSKRIGLYFTASVGGNGGSGDVERIAKLLQDKFNAEKLDEPARETIGLQYVSALLLSKLIVLDYVLSVLDPKDEMFPYWWLLLQIRPSNYISTDTGRDLFIRVMENLLLVDPQQLSNQLETFTCRI